MTVDDSGHIEPLKIFSTTLEIESRALLEAQERLEEAELMKLQGIFDLLIKTGGSLIFCGVGKSGIVGQKLASTFCSLGLSSFYLSPNEALHGDLGRVSAKDAITWISNSGSTEEILKLRPYIDIDEKMMIGLLGVVDSAIGKFCSVVLDCGVSKEACINNLAPTTSTTLAMAMGDSMAVLYEAMVGLTKEKYARFHPGGFLGKSLRLKVKDIMIEKKDCATVSEKAFLKDALLQMSSYAIGACAVIDDEDELKGIIVEGDFRRTFSKGSADFNMSIKDVYNPTPISINGEQKAFAALELMENRERPLNVLPVVEGRKFIGLLRLHDLLRAGLAT